MTDTEKIITESGVVLPVKENIMEDTAVVTIQIENHKECLLHWGVRRNIRTPWQVPPPSIWPEGSRAFDHVAVQTPFIKQNGQRQITIRLDRSLDFALIDFVLFFPEEGRWDNNHGRNYRIEIPGRERLILKKTSLGDPELVGIASEIIEKEMSRNSWTLMHRFNLCYDLLDKIKDNIHGLALIYVWLRFSAIRQLDWQRNYNTKPRELGHAMDRLTLKLAERYISEQGGREMIRLIMTTLGRGTNAQRVRDEVLNIMHRHHIKEVAGHFMEEWHQKLHNNATPDDIIICEAYLEFLRSNGNLDRFYHRLEDGGVTRERLESYERPIKSHPDFIPHLKEALIYDFEHFLQILREVHAGTDLGTSINLARYIFDAEMHNLMDFIWSHRDDRKMPISTLMEKITELRRRLTKQLKGQQQHYKARDLLFLDISLEDFLRSVVERNLGSHLSEDQQVELISLVLENLCLTYHNDVEFLYSLNHWNRLKGMPRFGKEWSLQAKAVIDRLGRALGSFIDRYHKLLQPKAEFLGSAFHADLWTITLFSEEVLRGRPVFVLSMLLRNLDPILRRSANLGSWQLISRGHGTGEVEVVEALKSVQGKNFTRPAIIIADSIAGTEEIPKGVAAIITPVVLDSLSHLAIRTRNAGLLFATCYDPDLIGRLKSLNGHLLKMSVKNNDVVFEESYEKIAFAPQITTPVRIAVSRPVFTAYAIPLNDFNEKNVGYKSINLRRIHGNLPGWINLPASVAIPFRVFEKVIEDESNKEAFGRYRELLWQIEKDEKKDIAGLLDGLRRTILTLNASDELVSSIHNVMEKAGLERPASWDSAWLCIKRVWGSKWNERAYLSRMANGIPHDDLVMSVLIQRVVEADYSFVIHTVNPFTGDMDEIYAEVVPGLGETLAGNYPGKSLSFTCKKGEPEPQLLSYPSKSVGLFGSGLIFRSDSNGEDLAGYAGAGLYDSFILPHPRKMSLDYTNNLLVRDERFLKDFMLRVADIGIEVEKVLGIPQDIECAYSRGQYYIVQTRPQVGIESDRSKTNPDR